MSSIKKISKLLWLAALLVFSGAKAFALVNEGKIPYHNTVIVGGGIAGLTAGYFLTNPDFVILEKNDRVGGRTVGGTRNGFSYAKGTEYLGEPEDALAVMIKRLGLQTQEIPAPMDAYFDGKQIVGGLKTYLVNNSSSAEYRRFAGLILREYAAYDELPNLEYTARMKYLDNITAKQWLMDNNFSEIYINKYNVSARGLFGAALDEISALSFIPEAAFDFDNSDLQDSAAADEDSADEETSGAFTFKTGISELTNKLGETLATKIKLNTTVTAVVKQSDNYLLSYTDKNGKVQQMLANKVIVALPAPIALKIAATVISKEQAALMSKVKYASYATAAMFSAQPIFDKAFDLAVPDGYFFTDIYDSTWVERFYTKNTTAPYIISAYIAPFSSQDHSLDNLSESALMKKVYRDLDKVFAGASTKVTGYDIERFPYAYPVMAPGAYHNLLQLNKLNNGKLILAGDYLIYPTFEAAVQSGYNAAQKINFPLRHK